MTLRTIQGSSQAGRVPPHDAEAEAAVLGSILLDETAISRVSGSLTADDFYREGYAAIYRAALKLHRDGAAIDNVTLAAELEHMGVLARVGGRAELATLQASVPTAVNVEHYARIVGKLAAKRRLQDIGRQVMEAGNDPALDPADVLPFAERVRELAAPDAPDLDGTAPAAPWPDPLAAAAFQGLAGEVVGAIEPTTEADPAGLLLQLLVYVGNWLGPGPHFTVEADRHGLNEYLCLVGETSKARKGTSEGRIRRLFQAVAEDWLRSCVKSGLSSGEGLIWQIRDPVTRAGAERAEVDPGVADKRLLIVESELATVLRRIERDGNSLSPVLRDAWDGRQLTTLTKNSPAGTTSSHISVIGHITKDELLRYLTRTEAANGLGNRFLWACVRRVRQLPLGGGLPNLNQYLGPLRDVLDLGLSLGRLVFDDPATRAWTAVYGPLSEGKPGLMGAMIARAEAHVLRLATIYAVLDLSPVVRLGHLLAGLAVWDYCEASARHVFGDAFGDPEADQVLAAIRSASPGGITRNELRDRFQRHLRAGALERALQALTGKGLVGVEVVATAGRPATRYLARTPPPPATTSYLELAEIGSGCAVSAKSAESPPQGEISYSDRAEIGPPDKCAESARKAPLTAAGDGIHGPFRDPDDPSAGPDVDVPEGFK